MAAFGIMISMARTRPDPSALGSRAWVRTASRLIDSMIRTWDWYWGGKMSMIRGDGLDGRVRVERRERQMARLGDPEAGLDRLVVPHLADQDDVRVLAQDRPQGVRVGLGVHVELALVDDGLAGVEEVLDRVLDGHDVDVPLAG